MLDTSYRIATPKVACQIIDNMAILIGFDTGVYYSADHVAALYSHRLLTTGMLAPELPALATAFGLPLDTLRADAERFLSRLIEAHLVEPGVPTAADVASAGECAVDATRPYEAPALKVYTDLEDILLLDPIHDVDAAGWPTPAGPAA